MTQDFRFINRRRLLLGSAALTLSTAVGCRDRESAPVAETIPERSDVPLRVAMVGADRDAQTIQRGWGAVTGQPLQIQMITLDRADPGGLADIVVAAAKKSDLVVFPMALTAEAAVAESIVPFSSDDFEEVVASSANLFPALRNGAGRYAGEYFAVPLGASLPAMLSTHDAAPVDSWNDYHDLVDEAWDGRAGEPSAPGWAGAMFLWRAATDRNWLFDRESLRPLVDTEPYVESLRLMARTHARYRSKRQTPEQVWSGIQSGQLMGGIAFPQRSIEPEDDLQAVNSPGVNDLSKVLLDPFSPVISLSSNCRQSAAAKRFIHWISGGEGSEVTRQQISGMTRIHASMEERGLDDRMLGEASHYDQWLATRLDSPVTLPTLQILQAGTYYGILDRQVGQALAGEVSPEQALSEVAKQWQATTQQVGVEKQLRTWRRVQGIRA